jgi:hypothetical protein
MDLEKKQETMRERWVDKSPDTPNPPLSAWKQFRLDHPTCVMVYRARKNAAKAGVLFDLTENDITVPEYCPVLGVRLQRGVGKPCYASPSLDRIVPAKGYVRGNVRVISYRANALKRDATLEELRLVLADLERIHGNPQ